MDNTDKEIKKLLKTSLRKIDQPNFSEKVMNKYLIRQEQRKNKRPVDLNSLIIGLLGCSLGLFMGYLNDLFALNLSAEELILLQIMPSFYLIFQILNEVFSIKNGLTRRLSSHP